ncbi:hypothetical protein BC938DRAFT_483700 [Jimgerdemannia flammicorona]|uniref:Uncharacterized protein n=1 Tax=Jimgerdemannia flammicorona TaxID=994334 RepID=A0A433QBH7_9FUNG|nr:hypothetical protein BC938DRAFT_483700 [Jimgerdemannia flammicorona]
METRFPSSRDACSGEQLHNYRTGLISPVLKNNNDNELQNDGATYRKRVMSGSGRPVPFGALTAEHFETGNSNEKSVSDSALPAMIKNAATSVVLYRL